MIKACLALLAVVMVPAASATPPGCPWDGTGDGRVDVEDLYHLTQNPADINGDGLADEQDLRCLEHYIRCAESRDMTGGRRPASDGLVASLAFRETTYPAATVANQPGSVQRLEVARRPSLDGCTSESWTMHLLGTNAALSGPIHLDAQRDGFDWLPAFNGADTAVLPPGTAFTLPGTLLCEGSAFRLLASWNSVEVGSDDSLRALILLDGQSITTKALQKGLTDAAARDIGGTLTDAYVNGSGLVTLPRPGREMLVLFELDAADTTDPAFAYDDLAIRIDLGCGDVDATARRQIVLRGSIGPDSSTTDGNFPFMATRVPGGFFASVPIVVSPTEDTTLIDFRGISGQLTETLEFQNFDISILIWDSPDAILSSPSHGNVFNATIPYPTTGPVPFGSMADFGFGLRPTYEVTVDLRPFALTVPAGSVYYVSVDWRSVTGIGLSGAMGWVETTEPGSPDIQYSISAPPRDLSTLPTSSHHGRCGVELIGEAEEP